jgi:diguanylate cyclase (GGDEF)-like protein
MISAAEILNASILIVDDQASNVLLLENMLNTAGYLSVSSTTDPYAVCKLHYDNHYDLILLDVMMPGMDGFEVMEAMKMGETTGYLPVLMVTAEPGHKRRALSSGARDFISKPFDLVESMTRIHNMLEVRLLYRQLELHDQEQESLALHDELTGLPNRRLLMDRLALAIAHASRSLHTMAVLYLDVDGFKQVNDRLGHDGGDALLRMISSRLLRTVRQEDTVARLGGDEFVIMMSEIKSTDDVAKLAEKLLQATAKHFYIQGGDVSITTSIGVSIFPAHGEDAFTLLKCADKALYEAKRAGKNAFRISTNTTLQEQTHLRIMGTTSAHWAES